MTHHGPSTSWDSWRPYGRDEGTIERRTGPEGTTITIDPDDNGRVQSFTIEEQDFNVRSLRGNAVMRWEYRPGSTLFVVCQQQRQGFSNAADLEATGDVGSAFRDPARNVRLVKVAYRVGR